MLLANSGEHKKSFPPDNAEERIDIWGRLPAAPEKWVQKVKGIDMFFLFFAFEQKPYIVSFALNAYQAQIFCCKEKETGR